MKFVSVCLLFLAWLQFIDCKDCRDGWTAFRDSCYLHVSEAFTWFDAKTACETEKGMLVEIGSTEENDFIIGLMEANNATWNWFGAEDMLVEGEWVLPSTGDKMTFTYWRPNEPNNYNGKEDCAIMGVEEPRGKWVDVPCGGLETAPASSDMIFTVEFVQLHVNGL